MPIYLTVEGVDGTASSVPHSGGVNMLMGDGSVKFIKYSGGVSPVGFQAFGANFRGGVDVAGSANTYGGMTTVQEGTLRVDAPTINGIYVSKISLPDSPFGGVDSREAGAAGKAGILFGAARSSTLSGGIVFSIPKDSNLRAFRILDRLALSGGRIPAMKVFVNDCGNPQGVRFEIKNARITSISEGDSRRAGKSSAKLFLFCATGQHI